VLGVRLKGGGEVSGNRDGTCTLTKSGMEFLSPPKVLMCAFTQPNATVWSMIPKLPIIVSPVVSFEELLEIGRKPRAPSL
jgi:hypothetical protein